jgi:DNA invertase Pin-like site-specific DNA recombinase
MSKIGSLVIELLQEALKDDENGARWLVEEIERLKRDGGDVKKLSQYEEWLARHIATRVQIRELLEPVGDSAAKETK